MTADDAAPVTAERVTGLVALLTNRQMPDHATPRVTLGDLRAAAVAIEAEAVARHQTELRTAVENLLAQPTFIGDEGFEPTLVAVSAGHLAALRAALLSGDSER